MRQALLFALAVAACGAPELERSENEDLPHEVDPAWPVLPAGTELGAVAGLAIDSRDRVYVFHRADADFDNDRIIESPTIFIFDPDTGELLDRWGAGMFVVPHGIAIDAEDHVWLTDTATNLVHELDPSGREIGRYDGL